MSAPPRPWAPILLLAAVTACGGETLRTNPMAPESAPVKVVAVDSAFGTLRFRGSVERVERQTTFEYVARLMLTFDANARTNSTTSIHLSSASLAATIRDPADPAGPRIPLHYAAIGVQADFVTDGETKDLPELRFVLPKTAEAQADHVGLSVTDGRLLWPVSVELKGI